MRRWLQYGKGGERKVKAVVGAGRGLSQGESEGARVKPGVEEKGEMSDEQVTVARCQKPKRSGT